MKPLVKAELEFSALFEVNQVFHYDCPIFLAFFLGILDFSGEKLHGWGEEH